MDKSKGVNPARPQHQYAIMMLRKGDSLAEAG